MKLLDSNILIYAPQPDYSYLRPLLSDSNSAVSEISMLEVLGFTRITPIEIAYYETLFKNMTIISINRDIILKAIELRQTRKMTIGDSIIASTAVIGNHTLYTKNDVDFKWIKGLTLQNPV
jgi:toxin FitB